MARTFDETELLARIDNDTAFLAETVDMLTSDGPPLLDQLHRALAAGDAPAVSRTAHSIKGMVSNFCAAGAHAAAQRVEQFGKSGDLAAAPAAAQTLHEDLDSLTRELLEFVKAKA
jgi:HPt (histidine-containing phosphotransfer) domain-containing protein